MNSHIESGIHHSILRINKFNDVDGKVAALSRAGASPDTLKSLYPSAFLGEEIHEGNILVNVGIQGLWKLACGLATSPAAWNAAGAKIRVGTGSGAAAATDTQATFTAPVDLAMDSNYPALVGQQIQFHGTATGLIGNIAWNEFGVINGDSTPVLLNRFVISKGTKASGETWTCEIDITIS